MLLLAAWAGCKENPDPLTDIDPAGTYALVTIEGNPLPCEFTHEGQSMTVQSGTFTINPDGTCTSTMSFSVEPAKVMSREVQAADTRNGSTLTMNWEGAGFTTGTVDGNIFTLVNEGMTLCYRK